MNKKILTDKEFNLFKTICSLSQKDLKKQLSIILNKKYKNNVYEKGKFIMAIGDIPVALVAHMDTVFKVQPYDFFYDKDKNVIWSPDGLGADDRAGVFAILEILKRGLKPTIIFTCDEEVGGVGAMDLIRYYTEAPTDIKYIIELDRQGAKDCVFYRCENPSFTKYVESFGFKTNYGTFSDISIICPQWKIAGVNLSIGYIEEHSYTEHLYVSFMYDTIDKVEKMLKEKKISSFEYIANSTSVFSGWNKEYWLDNPKEESDIYTCAGCGKDFYEEDLIDCLINDNELKHFCIDCCVDKVGWCDMCGNPYVLPKNDNHLCDNCRADHKEEFRF